MIQVLHLVAAIVSWIGDLHRVQFLREYGRKGSVIFAFFGPLAWLITATILRWNNEGWVISGDNLIEHPVDFQDQKLYMIHSGTFLTIWIYLCYILWGVGLCAFMSNMVASTIKAYREGDIGGLV